MDSAWLGRPGDGDENSANSPVVGGAQSLEVESLSQVELPTEATAGTLRDDDVLRVGYVRATLSRDGQHIFAQSQIDAPRIDARQVELDGEVRFRAGTRPSASSRAETLYRRPDR